MIRNNAKHKYFINWEILKDYNKWSYDQIKKFRTFVKTEINKNLVMPDNLIDTINTIIDYKLPYQEDFESHYNENLYYHQKGIEKYFKDIIPYFEENSEKKQIPYKSFQKMFQQFKERNILDDDDFKTIEDSYKQIDTLKNTYKKLKDEEITEIAITYKNKKNNTNINKNEIIALINEAIKRNCNFYLNDIQIISILCFLNKKNDKGRIAQILTGEGKTMIVVTLACFNVLLGHKVDIVTSSEVLAIRDAEDDYNNQIYDMLGIKVSHCIDKRENIEIELQTIKKEDKKNCYESNIDIIYGDTHNFQADYLRDKYLKDGTRKGRETDIIIVDEIDSMFIDEYGKSTLLASDKPYMDKLNYIIILMWLGLVNESITENFKNKIISDKNIEEKIIKLVDKLLETKKSEEQKNEEQKNEEQKNKEKIGEFVFPKYLKEYIQIEKKKMGEKSCKFNYDGKKCWI